VGGNPDTKITVNGVVAAYNYLPAVAGYAPYSFAQAIVPSGATYVVTIWAGTIGYWAELR
jgi:hypothetical protein